LVFRPTQLTDEQPPQLTGQGVWRFGSSTQELVDWAWVGCWLGVVPDVSWAA